MLIEKKSVVGVNDVISLKLVTGEELIGKIVAMDDASVTLSKPLVIQMQMVSANQAGIGFIPFLSSIDTDTAKVCIKLDNLICDPIKTRKDISSKYLSMTSGLDLVSGKDFKL